MSPTTNRGVPQVPRDGEDRDWRRQLLNRIRREYHDLPDLKLTSWQACCLWNLAAPLCDGVLETLVSERFLKRTVDGVYVRRGMGRRPLRTTGPDQLPREPDGDHSESDVDEPSRDIPLIDEPNERPRPEHEADFLYLGV